MNRTRLLFGLAAVFAGITVMLVVLGFAYSLLLLGVAVPFGLTTFFLWYHASGRLADRTRRRMAAGAYRQREQGFGAGARRANAQANRERSRGGARGRRRQRQRQRTSVGESRVSATEAYQTLDLDPGAGQDAVRQAYREKVKTVHPDRENGSEEAFKRVNRAYERLRDER